MKTTQFNHAPAQIFMNTGHQVIGRPSLGAWLSYGLGSENADLPAFIVLLSGENNPDGGKSCWGSGFLPTGHQGVEFRSGGDPVLFVSNPSGVSPDVRRRSLDAIRDLNTLRQGAIGDPEIHTRIAAYEMAYRMQTSVPELTDLSREPASVHELYGTRARPGLVREQLPARAPPRRTRRPLRPALSPRLGHTRRLASARTSSKSSRTCAGRPIGPSPRCSPISSSADSSTTRSSSGAASSDARR